MRAIEEMKPNGAWKPGASRPAVKDFPPPEVLKRVLEQHKRSGAERGIYFRETLGWVLVCSRTGLLGNLVINDIVLLGLGAA